jgi:ClpP class serine protease
MSILHSILNGGWLLERQFGTAITPIAMEILLGNTTNLKNITEGFISKQDNSIALMETVASSKNINVENLRLTYNYNTKSYVPSEINKPNSIAFLSISGVIMKNPECSTGSMDQANLINFAANNPNVIGLVISIDSPGGMVDGTATVADAIKYFNTKGKVSTAVINDGMACSAAYWIASTCTYVYCTQVTDTIGSVGAYQTVADMYKYYDKQGLQIRDVYSRLSPLKNISSKMANQGDDSFLKDKLDFVVNTFINHVGTARKGRIASNSDANWQKGETYNAVEALKEGMIDGIKSFDEVLVLTATKSKKSPNYINQNNKNMAFEKIMQATSITEIAVVDGGFLMEEAALNILETKLIEYNQLKVDSEQFNQLKVANELAIQEANNNLNTATELNGQKDETIAALNTKVTELQGQIAVLGKKASGTGTFVAAGEKGDADNNQQNKVSTLSPEHPLNKQNF